MKTKNAIKNVAVLIVAACLQTTTLQASKMTDGSENAADTTSAYFQAMQKGVQQLFCDSANFPNLLSYFERIAESETDKWIPAYYCCFIQIRMSHKSKDADAILDKAQLWLDKATKANGEKSELAVLQAWLHQMRINVSPMARGMKYSQLASESLGAASAMNPENPRIYYLDGMNIFHTPKAFGGGAENACPKFTLAQQKFNAFKLANPIWPNWGKKNNEKMLNNCNF